MSTRTQIHHATAALLALAAAPAAGCAVEATPQPVVVQAEVVATTGATEDVAVDDFQAPLANYGVWVDTPGYGRVWQPGADVAGAEFTPYGSDGTWVTNDDGEWVFQSRYDAQWGWATYHYGRWVSDDRYGWVWIPGRTWAPAWVDWRYGGGYVGWAPMGPPGVVVVEDRWVFVERGHMGGEGWWGQRVSREHAHEVFTAATPIVEVHGNGRWSAGPPFPEIRAAGGVVASVHVSAPAAGYVRVQARAVQDGAADRRAQGRVPTAPQLRSGAGVSARVSAGGGVESGARVNEAAAAGPARQPHVEGPPAAAMAPAPAPRPPPPPPAAPPPRAAPPPARPAPRPAAGGKRKK